ncbi:MAG: endonuclease VIII [Acetatifactor sp.]
MMELPESYLLAKQVNEFLRGKCISEVKTLQSPHKFAFFKGDVEAYSDMLEGQTIEGARHVGGMLEIDTEEYMIVFADGLTPRYYEDIWKAPKKHQLAFFFDDESALICTIRMYGIVHVYPKGLDDDGYFLSSASKPDPLTQEFTYEYFRNLYPAGKKLSAKAFLATEQRIPGLGNGVLQDILWDAGIDPRYPMLQASEEDFQVLYHSVVTILRKMCEDGGRDVENDLFGNAGGYVSQLSKNSLEEPCMRCGTLIHRANYMGGTVYFCECCQKRG